MSETQLYPFQTKAIEALQAPGHLICVSPTGSGKSLIYEKVAKKPGFRSVLISPLIALARQQRERLSAAGLDTALAAGKQSDEPPAKSGVWIMSPERLENPVTMATLQSWRPHFLIVDECHCLWDWGSHFRPAFSKVPELLKITSIERSLWLTATLPLDARKELLALLPQPKTVLGRFGLPPGLFLTIKRTSWSERPTQLLDWVSQQKEAGIIFVQSRADSHRLALLLRATGKLCAVYHAGLAHEERALTEKSIDARVPDIVIATSAFGMGMNHTHLRWSLLWQAPPSLLSLAQAIGRAGRDSRFRSNAMVFWDDEDFALLDWLAKNSRKQREELQKVQQYLTQIGCRAAHLQRYFDGQWTQASCNQCDFCFSDFPIQIPL